MPTEHQGGSPADPEGTEAPAGGPPGSDAGRLARVRRAVNAWWVHLRTPAGRVDAVFWLLFLLALGVTLAPMWIGVIPPLTDFGGHAEMAHIWTHIDDPLYSELFVRNDGLLMSNVLTARFASLVSPWLGAISALRLFVTLCLALTACGFLYTLRAFERSRWLVFLALPFLWNGMTLLGVMSFVASMTVFVWALGLARRAAVTGRWPDAIKLGVAALIGYYAHGLGCALVLVAAVFVTLASARRRSGLRGLVALLPVLALWLGWFLEFRAVAPADVSVGSRYIPTKDELVLWAYEAFDPSRTGSWDSNILLLIGVVLLVLFATQVDEPSASGEGAAAAPPGRRSAIRRYLATLAEALHQHTLVVLLIGLGLGYFLIAPTFVGTAAFPMGPRLVPLMAFVVVMLPRGRLAHPLARIATGVGVVTSLAAGSHLADDVRAWGALELEPLVEVVDQVPEGSRVQCLGVINAMTVLYRKPLNNGCHGLVTARRGGLGHGGFAHTLYNAVAFKDKKDFFRLSMKHLENYAALSRLDYVIVRGHHRGPPDGVAEKVATAEAEGPFEPGLDGPLWTLYRIRREGSRATSKLMTKKPPGGYPFGWECPPGMAVSALEVTLDRRGVTVAGVRPTCRTPGPPREEAGQKPAAWAGSPTQGPRIGGKGGRRRILQCGTGERVVGLAGASGLWVDRVKLACAPEDRDAATPFKPSFTKHHGGAGGHPYTLQCPADDVVIGIHGLAGAVIDAIGVGCAPLDQVRSEAAEAAAAALPKWLPPPPKPGPPKPGPPKSGPPATSPKPEEPKASPPKASKPSKRRKSPSASRSAVPLKSGVPLKPAARLRAAPRPGSAPAPPPSEAEKVEPR